MFLENGHAGRFPPGVPRLRWPVSAYALSFRHVRRQVLGFQLLNHSHIRAADRGTECLQVGNRSLGKRAAVGGGCVDQVEDAVLYLDWHHDNLGGFPAEQVFPDLVLQFPTLGWSQPAK